VEFNDATFSPKGSLQKQYLPSGVLKVISLELSSLNEICI